MHVLTVAYGRPTDPHAFDTYYAESHLPLARRIPGLVDITARHCASLDGSEPPYYLLAQLAFESEADLQAGMGSDVGKAAAADLKNFADGGAALFVQHEREPIASK